MRILIVCLLLSGPLLRAQFPEPATPPNIVVILADDLGYNDVGAYTHGDGTSPAPYDPSSYAPLPGPNQAAGLTPRIDSLATEGLKFTNYYASAAQCSPARAALLTGTYPYRNGIPEVLIPNANDPARARGLHENERTLPELLKERGYATAAVGKWHLGDTLQFLPTRHGFDSWFGIPYSNDMWPFNTGRGSWPALYLYENDGTTDYTTATGGQITGEITTDAEQSYLLEAMTEKALAFIDAEKDRPFFLYFSPHAVHVPCFPHPDFRGDTVSWYYDQVKELDHRVGQIMDRLETHGLTQNTIVIFSSDNGPWLNRNRPSDAEQAVGSAYPLWGRKSTVWEGGPRVPFLVKWPAEIPAGEVRDQIAQHIDLLPTLVKLAGGEVPAEPVIDGGDLWPVWKENGTSPSDEFYYFMSTTLYAVRKGDWKYYSTSGSGADAGTLVNLDTDIQEQTDVSGTNGAKVTELSGLRTTFWNEINANDRPPGSHSTQGIVVEQLEIGVPEGGSASFRVRLLENPGSPVTVSIARHSGDPDLDSNASVVKDSTNWNSWSFLSVSAAEDGDMLDGGATFRIMAPGIPFREVVALEEDNDTVPVVEPVLERPANGKAVLPNALHGIWLRGGTRINLVESPEGSTFIWSQVSGPQSVIFHDADALQGGAEFPQEGTYILRLTTGYPGAGSAFQDFEVVVGGTPVAGPDRIQSPLDSPGSGTFGPTGVTNYYALNDSLWHEESNGANNQGTNTDGNLREVLQDEANASVPLTTHGTHWLNLAPNTSYPSPAVYQDIGVWQTSDPTTLDLQFDLGERSTVTAGALWLQICATDSDFKGNDGVLLSTASDFRLLDQTDVYRTTDSGWQSVTGGRIRSGVAASLTLSGVEDGQRLWVRVVATGSGSQSLLDGLEIRNAPDNVGPTVDPGSILQVAYAEPQPDLVGTISDDGRPGLPIQTTWQQASGPFLATIGSEESVTTSLNLPVPGTYRFQLRADDGLTEVYREVERVRLHQTYSEWTEFFSIPVNEREPDDNPDQDAYPNLFEFAFGSNPMLSGPASGGNIRLNKTETGWVAELEVPASREPNLRLVYRNSLQGAGSWTEVLEGPTQEIQNETEWYWSFPLTPPALNGETLFYRIEVTP